MTDSLLFLDVRELPAPEPLNKVMELLRTVDKNDVICMKHRQKPNLLFDLLTRQGYLYQLERNASDFLIYIWHSSNPNAALTISREKNSVSE